MAHRKNNVSTAPVRMPANAAAHRLLTTMDVAERLQVSSRTIRRLIAEGTLKMVRIGRSVRITEKALDAYLTGDDER